MISYQATSTFSGHGTASSVTRSSTGTGDGVAPGTPVAWTHSETEWATSFQTLPGGHSSASSRLTGSEEVPDNNGGFATVGVGRSWSRNETGSSRTSTTWQTTDTATGVTTYTASESGTAGATSFSLSTSTTAATTLTRTGTATATQTTTAATLTTNAAGASVTTTSASTYTATTSATSTQTDTTESTASASAAVAASQGTFLVFRAGSGEAMMRASNTSTSHQPVDAQSLTGWPVSGAVSDSGRILSVQPGAATTYSWAAPAALTTYTASTWAVALAATATATVMTSQTTTASIANSANPAASTSTTLTRWSTATATLFRDVSVTATSTQTWEGWSHWSYAQTWTVRTLTTRAFWGHGAGLTATTYGAHGIMETVTVTSRTGAASSQTATTTMATIRALVETTSATLAAAVESARFAQESSLTSDFVNDSETAVGATFTAGDYPGRAGSFSLHRSVRSRHELRAQEPEFLPAWQASASFADTDARHLDVALTANGSTATGRARGAVSLHVDEQGAGLTVAPGASASAARVAASHWADLSRASSTTFTTYTESAGSSIRSAGWGGLEQKRPSFSDVVAFGEGVWRGTTQEGTSTGTTNYPESAHLTGSSARRTAVEPLATVTLDRALQPAIGHFDTLKNCL